MRIALGSDHFGYDLKEFIKEYLTDHGHEVEDYGCHDQAEIDYPDIAAEVARAIARGDETQAILVCGTGIGMAITANKVPGVYAAVVSDPYSAERARKSNNAQVLCLGGNVVGADLAALLVDHWLASEFGGGRSARKVGKIKALEDDQSAAGKTTAP